MHRHDRNLYNSLPLFCKVQFDQFHIFCILIMAAPALAYVLVFYLYLHACTARLLMVSDKKFVAQRRYSRKDVETSDHTALKMVQLDNQKNFSVEEGEINEGKKTKSSYYWKILHQATGTEISKRVDRSMLASSPSNAEEKVSTKDNGAVEDIVVMDYAQPHRKPPIHNKGT